MSSLYTIAASLTLFLPFIGQMTVETDTVVPEENTTSAMAPICQSPGNHWSGEPAMASHSEAPPAHSEFPRSQLSDTNALDAIYEPRTVNQVRIKRSVTVRITPYRQSNRNRLFAQLPRRGVTRAYEEREMGTCVPVSGIAGVQTGTGNRLILFLRDERIVSLNLARGCEARDFYSGFYVERNEDGRLCVKRDLLQSRSGAKCEVERMQRLVLTED